MSDTRGTGSDAGRLRAAAGGLGTGAGFLIGSCVLVATAAYLGVGWLRETVLGLPAGLWTIFAAYGAHRWVMKESSGRAAAANDLIWSRHPEEWERPAAGEDDAEREPWPFGPVPDPTERRPASAERRPQLDENEAVQAPAAVTGDLVLVRPRSIGEALLIAADAATWAAAAVAPERYEPSAALEALSRWHDRLAWPARPLRVGVDLPGEVSAPLVRSPGARVDWVPIRLDRDEKAACLVHGLDAVLSIDGEGQLRLTTAEAAEREAGWFDWATRLPLSYNAVFPGRIDPCMITLGPVRECTAQEADLIGRLVTAAALLSRSPMRLGLRDRLRGRRPLGVNDRRAFGATEPVADAMSGLAAGVLRLGGRATTVERAAARVASAWAATAEGSLSGQERREIADAAFLILSDEPEAALRAAAARFAEFDDAAALEALSSATDLLIRQGVQPVPDPALFLEAEIRLGLESDTTFGRVAAGMCLVCATADDAKVEYIAEDVLEEMRYTGWLIGREPDRRTLIEIAQMARRARGGVRREAA